VIITFPPERVMSALAPLEQPAPPIQPSTQSERANSPPAPKSDIRRKLLFRIGM
jgi:two-component system cell cycle sensor histidine kinase PleC